MTTTTNSYNKTNMATGIDYLNDTEETVDFIVNNNINEFNMDLSISLLSSKIRLPTTEKIDLYKELHEMQYNKRQLTEYSNKLCTNIKSNITSHMNNSIKDYVYNDKSYYSMIKKKNDLMRFVYSKLLPTHLKMTDNNKYTEYTQIMDKHNIQNSNKYPLEFYNEANEIHNGMALPALALALKPVVGLIIKMGPSAIPLILKQGPNFFKGIIAFASGGLKATIKYGPEVADFILKNGETILTFFEAHEKTIIYLASTTTNTIKTIVNEAIKKPMKTIRNLISSFIRNQKVDYIDPFEKSWIDSVVDDMKSPNINIGSLNKNMMGYINYKLSNKSFDDSLKSMYHLYKFINTKDSLLDNDYNIIKDIQSNGYKQTYSNIQKAYNDSLISDTSIIGDGGADDTYNIIPVGQDITPQLPPYYQTFIQKVKEIVQTKYTPEEINKITKFIIDAEIADFTQDSQEATNEKTNKEPLAEFNIILSTLRNQLNKDAIDVVTDLKTTIEKKYT